VTSRGRSAILILTHASALALGAAAGAWVGFDTARAARALSSEIGEVEWYSAHVFADRLMGDPVLYKNTLLQFLAALNARRAGNGVLLPDHALAVDITLTEARLALLAEAQAAGAESKTYFAQALAHCRAAWADTCTEDRLREMVMRLDHGGTNQPQKPP